MLTMMLVSLAALFTSCKTPSNELLPQRVVKDGLGRDVAVPSEIKRIVSLAPNLTELVFATGAGDRLVGVTSFCNYPEATKSISKVGDTINPNLESIIALKPDVVLVTTSSQIETFSSVLRSNNIAVYVTDPRSINGVIDDVRRLGELFGTQELSNRVADDLAERIDKVKRMEPITPKPRVFVQISREPIFTLGKGAFISTAVDIAGGVSVTSDISTDYPTISKEAAAAFDPDVIFISEGPDNQTPSDAFKNSKAVANERVFKISADLLSRPGPRVVDALEKIAIDLREVK